MPNWVINKVKFSSRGKEHIDYQTIIRINELVEKSYNDNELDEVNKIGIHIE